MSEKEKSVLESWVRAFKTESRTVFRANIILRASEGETNQAIAAEMKIREATVSKWRSRFAVGRLKGLADAPRRGAKRKYGKETERRILGMLDENTASAYNVVEAGVSAQILNLPPRRPTSWVFIFRRRKTQL